MFWQSHKFKVYICSVIAFKICVSYSILHCYTSSQRCTETVFCARVVQHHRTHSRSWQTRWEKAKKTNKKKLDAPYSSVCNLPSVCHCQQIHSSSAVGSKQRRTHLHAHMYIHAWGQCILALLCNYHQSKHYAVKPMVVINPGVSEEERERERGRKRDTVVRRHNFR